MSQTPNSMGAERADLALHCRGSDQLVVADPDALYVITKRLLDVTLCCIALLALAPLLALIALAIRLDSPGPIIFAQDRVGWDPRRKVTKIFTFYKFRSMRHSADPALHRQHMAKLIKENWAPDDGEASLKLANDPRITRVGRVLRRTSLDELPQIINVLNGDMSLVGPRPAIPYEVAEYKEWHKQRLQALPGLTGWWQVMGRSRVSFDDSVRMDIYYVNNRSLLLDLKIMLLTPWAVISLKGAG